MDNVLTIRELNELYEQLNYEVVVLRREIENIENAISKINKIISAENEAFNFYRNKYRSLKNVSLRGYRMDRLNFNLIENRYLKRISNYNNAIVN
jgi:uncharacterized protein (DUF2344 family)